MAPAFTTLIELLAHNAKTHADRAAVMADGNMHSHAMLYQAVQGQAAALAAMGVKRGDRVLLLAGNRPEVLVLLGAAAWNSGSTPSQRSSTPSDHTRPICWADVVSCDWASTAPRA